MIAGHHSMIAGGAKYKPIFGVKSDGVAYCALPGFINSSYGAFEADFTITSSYSGDWHAWGAHGKTDNKTFFLLNFQRSTSSNGAYAFGSVSSAGRGLKFYANSRYTLYVGRSSSSAWGYLNGSSVFDRAFGNPVYNPGKFLVFRASATNSTTNPQARSSPTFLVIHRLKVWYNEDLAADLIPCRDISHEVCFYNSVDGQFIKNVAGGTSKLIEVTKS